MSNCNKLTINTDCRGINVYDPVDKVITVKTLGPQGPPGLPGPSGSFPTSGSFVFTGSFIVSGSIITTGSIFVTNNIVGTLVGTASWAQNAISASYIPASGVDGLSLSRIATGSISASVDTDPTKLFIINAGATQYLSISSSGDTTVYSDLFIIRNITSKQPVFKISGSIVQITTHSYDPAGITEPGTIWFTTSSMYIGLE